MESVGRRVVGTVVGVDQKDRDEKKCIEAEELKEKGGPGGDRLGRGPCGKIEFMRE